MSEKQAKESQTYQGMIDRVEGIIENISSADCDLDTMVDKVEEGYLLIKKLKDRLNTTREKIEKLQLDYEQTEGKLDG
ncbi:MAG: exodeoxyribonuclease VII small subunit [Oligoflexales bacterium]|nr:exodeoxyribonuclease VII small subunit [Oligoflexales bacterium]